jgi:hypothetical protein
LSAACEKAMEIKHADVAELVDARDLKSPDATDAIPVSCLKAADPPTGPGGNPAGLSNSKPADRLADIRAQIAVLRVEEAALRAGFISGELSLEGNDHVVAVERKQHQRIDGPALRKNVDEEVWAPFVITAATDYVTVRKK